MPELPHADLPPDVATDLLKLRAMPDVAVALLAAKEGILRRWEADVQELLPDADPLTAKEVRDTIPVILDRFAEALAADDDEPTRRLAEYTRGHGVARYAQSYDVAELMVEYRVLRRVVIEQTQAALPRPMELVEVLAMGTGIDLAVQQSVVAFVDFQSNQLKSTAEAQSKYLSYLSHDLRNNMNGILLTMEVIERDLHAEARFEEDVQEIQSLKRMIGETMSGMDRLLQAERLRAGKARVEIGPVDLGQVAGGAVRMAQRAADEKRLALACEVPPDAVALGDGDLIGIVLQNLLGNAIKYSSRGTVRVTAARRDAARWTLAVSDEGPGIAPEQVAALFDAFSRGATYGQPGVGLGLSIASHGAHALGGQLEVESQVGAGSTFRLTLPAQLA